MVLANSRRVEVGYHGYDDVPLADFLTALQGAALPRRHAAACPEFHRRPFMRADDTPSEGPIRVACLVAEINRFFAEHGEMPLVADTGDALFVSHEIDTQDLLASAYYATMGFAVPAALGFETVTGRRPLVLVGDGAFQMTGAELIHALRWGLKPIVVVMNNASWEMLQSFLPSGYNELPDWRYAATAALWGAATWKATTAGELRQALEAALVADRAVLIEVPLSRGDVSDTLATFTRSVGTAPRPPSPPPESGRDSGSE
jgi:indolepyruvate decarboxylase